MVIQADATRGRGTRRGWRRRAAARRRRREGGKAKTARRGNGDTGRRYPASFVGDNAGAKYRLLVSGPPPPPFSGTSL